MRTDFVDQKLSKCRMLALSKQSPKVGIWKGLEGGDFQFQEVVLTRVEIDGMNALWVRRNQIIQEIIPG